MAVRRENQKLADQWATEASDLRSEIQSLEAQDGNDSNGGGKKSAVYMKDLGNKMATLKKKEQAANEIRNELEPFLDQTLQEMQDFSKSDLPMLTELQAPLLRATENALDNADADMVQKTRHLLGTVTQALEYGYFPQVDESEIDVGGRHIRVQRLSVGRLALFALSGDGRDAWKWQRETARYEPIPHFARSIEEVIQITQRTRLGHIDQIASRSAQRAGEGGSPVEIPHFPDPPVGSPREPFGPGGKAENRCARDSGRPEKCP